MGNREANGQAEQNEPRPSRNVVVVGANGSEMGISRGRPRLLYFGTPAGHGAEQQRIPKDAKIHLNVPRLTHYIEESNQGKGFIKELSFSPDGRFIASPFAHGVRLLAFSPCHWVMVTGCLSGRISWHQPVV